MFDVNYKRPEDDLPVIIKEDVWIGAGAIILKGMTLGHGSIVAGAVVAKSVPPYAIAVGSPAKVLKYRWAANFGTRTKALSGRKKDEIMVNEIPLTSRGKLKMLDSRLNTQGEG